jgi:hypothetical protein
VGGCWLRPSWTASSKLSHALGLPGTCGLSRDGLLACPSGASSPPPSCCCGVLVFIAAVTSISACQLPCALACLAVVHVRLISSWSHRVQVQVALKYAKPCPLQEGMAAADPDFEYRRVVKYNYTPEDLSVMASTISMIKALASLILVCATHVGGGGSIAGL